MKRARQFRLSRLSIDEIARAVVTGRRRGRGRIDSLADLVAARLRNRLEAVDAPGARRARNADQVHLEADPEVVRSVIERTTKHLAVWGRRADAGAHAD